MNTLCFVLMPFGTKTGPSGSPIDFDAVYNEVIRPAVIDAGLEPIRADEEQVGGIIHKPMFERLILCAYAVADLSQANANVFYELGIRHAVRPRSTVAIFADGTRLPFDIHMLRGMPYRLDADGKPSAAAEDRGKIAERLRFARKDSQLPVVDSPVYQLVDCIVKPDIDHAKTDVFGDQVRYSAEAGKKLAAARREGKEAAVEKVRRGLQPMDTLEAAVTLMEVRTGDDPLQRELLPVVEHAVRIRMKRGKPDYWDYATLLELAVLARNERKARDMLSNALVKVREPWEPETTANNLRMILDARSSRGEPGSWVNGVVSELLKRAGTLT